MLRNFYGPATREAITNECAASCLVTSHVTSSSGQCQDLMQSHPSQECWHETAVYVDTSALLRVHASQMEAATYRVFLQKHVLYKL